MRLLTFVLLGSISIYAIGDDSSIKLGDPPLTPRQTQDLIKAIGSNVKPSDLSVEDIQLSTNHTRQIAVRGESSAMANSQLWIFQLSGGRAVLILDGGGGSMYTALPMIHRGMHDFATFWNMGETGDETVYRFDGHRYQTAYCDTQTSNGNGGFRDGPHHSCK